MNKFKVGNYEIEYDSLRVKDYRELKYNLGLSDDKLSVLESVITSKVSEVKIGGDYYHGDIKDLPAFVFDALYLNIKALTTGKMIVGNYICQTEVEEKLRRELDLEDELDADLDSTHCNTRFTVNIDLTDYELTTDVDKWSKLKGSTYELILHPPSFRDWLKLSENNSDDVSIISKYIKGINVKDDGVWEYKEVDNPQQALEYIDELPIRAANELTNKFKNPPQLQYKASTKCSNCGTVHEINLVGLLDFFT